MRIVMLESHMTPKKPPDNEGLGIREIEGIYRNNLVVPTAHNDCSE